LAGRLRLAGIRKKEVANCRAGRWGFQKGQLDCPFEADRDDDVMRAAQFEEIFQRSMSW